MQSLINVILKKSGKIYMSVDKPNYVFYYIFVLIKDPSMLHADVYYFKDRTLIHKNITIKKNIGYYIQNPELPTL